MAVLTSLLTKVTVRKLYGSSLRIMPKHRHPQANRLECKWFSSMEEWRDVPEWEGYYQVSNLGRVRSVPRVVIKPVRGTDVRKQVRSRFLRQTKKLTKHGYLVVTFSRCGKTKTFAVHILVLIAFRGPSIHGQVSRHLDGNRFNNRLTNLEWGTQTQNMHDRVFHETNFGLVR